MTAFAGILSGHPRTRDTAAVAASALLAFLYARGGAGWVLGLVVLVPWLRALDAPRSPARTLLLGWAMAVAYTLAVFGWWIAAVIAAGLGTTVAAVLTFRLIRHRADSA